jgi:hypothetical protein
LRRQDAARRKHTISQACPPETLFKIVARAVRDALSDSDGRHGARLFLLRCLGADQIRVYLNGLYGLSAPNPPSYDLSGLDDKEMMLLDRLSAKMTISKEEGGQL